MFGYTFQLVIKSVFLTADWANVMTNLNIVPEDIVANSFANTNVHQKQDMKSCVTNKLIT